MAKDPAFLFYSSDFFLGVSTMSFEDRGKYITLLCMMHQQGRMTEETIRFIVGSISVTLKSKFQISETGEWYNERLEIETQKRKYFTESRKLNGKQGGRPLKIKNKKANVEPNAKPNAKPTDNHIEDENINVNKSKNPELVFKHTSPEFMNVWRILSHSKKWKNKTTHAYQLSLDKLNSVSEQDAITMMNNAIENNWQGVFFLSGKNNNTLIKKVGRNEMSEIDNFIKHSE